MMNNHKPAKPENHRNGSQIICLQKERVSRLGERCVFAVNNRQNA